METILSIRNLDVDFVERKRRFFSTTTTFSALKNISLDVQKGECLGIIGESGSGKTTLARVLARLQPYTNGNIYFQKHDIRTFSRKIYAKHVQMIFQSPHNALNPHFSIEQILQEPLKIHFPELSVQQRHAKIFELLDAVQLPQSILTRRPAELSGGQKQRIAIARAIAVQPEFLICDEVVSALDATLQNEILQLLASLFSQRHLSGIFVSHDMNSVTKICHRVAVLFHGKIVEIGPTDKILKSPEHPYTKELILSGQWNLPPNYPKFH